MNRHELLAGLHDVVQPRTYFEIGVDTGRSMTLSRTRSIGVDPFYKVTRELRADLHLVRATSDEFFARPHPLAHFDSPVIDLAFIDGMHLAEFALRDFINTEKYCHPGSVIVFDDMLPKHVDEAGRGREAGAARGAWAGDVYKVVDTLRALRPDLVVLELDTAPTGTLVVLVPDPESRVLDAAYDDLVPEYVVPDPQDVPAWALDRTDAITGTRLLESPVWETVRAVRNRPGPGVRDELRSAYRAAGLVNPR